MDISPIQTTVKKTLLASLLTAGLLFGSSLQAQTIDYGMTAMTVQSPASTPLVGGGFQLLAVTPSSGYNPAGATLADLLNTSNMLTVSNSFTTINVANPGQFYQAGLAPIFSTGATIAGGTKLYILASTSATFELTAPWALVSGTNVNWLSPVPTDPFGFSGIELSLTGNSIVAGVGASWSPPGSGDPLTVSDPAGSSLILVPEPSTYALLSLAGMALGGYMIRRRRRA
jgi:PEP-CTERM motif